jgi:hypothetical protein
VLPDNVTRIAVLQHRIDAIREIVAATHQEDLRGILLDMLEDGERALAQLAKPPAELGEALLNRARPRELAATSPHTIVDHERRRGTLAARAHGRAGRAPR